VNAVQTENMAERDILSVSVYNDTAYVNLSENFKQSCAGISAKSEMLLIYAIVNTATAMDGINKVQFLVEGAQTDTLAGHLCISDPFLRNYGMIKNGS
jgi:spore germination protein GerM